MGLCLEQGSSRKDRARGLSPSTPSLHLEPWPFAAVPSPLLPAYHSLEGHLKKCHRAFQKGSDKQVAQRGPARTLVPHLQVSTWGEANLGRAACSLWAGRPAQGGGPLSPVTAEGSAGSCRGPALAPGSEAPHSAGGSPGLFVNLRSAGTEGEGAGRGVRSQWEMQKGVSRADWGGFLPPLTHTSQPGQLLFLLIYLPSKILLEETITEPRKFEKPFFNEGTGRYSRKGRCIISIFIAIFQRSAVSIQM